MIIRFLKNNKQYSIFFYLLLGLVFWAHRFYSPATPINNGSSLNWLNKALQSLPFQSDYVSIFIAFALMIALAILVDLITQRFGFEHNKTPLTGILYIIILGEFIDLHDLHPVYLSGIILSILIFKVFLLEETPHTASTLFQIGLFFGFSTIIYLHSIVLLPFVLTGILLFRQMEIWRTLTIFLLGIVLPFIFIFSPFYLLDIKIPQSFFNSINFHFGYINKYKEVDVNLSLILNSIFLSILTVISSYKIIRQFVRKKIIYRNYYTILFLSFVTPLLGYTFIAEITRDILILSMVSLTFIIANFLYYNKNQYVNNAIFFMLILFALFRQYSFYV